MDYRNMLTTSFANIDLNFASAARLPRFSYPKSKKYASPISLLRCYDPPTACIHIKDWLLDNFNNAAYAAPGIIRMESQLLHQFPTDYEGLPKEGWILLAEDAALMDTGTAVGLLDAPVTVLAVLVPGDAKVRWFYTLLPIASLLQRLDDYELIDLNRSWNPGTEHHKRFATYIREEFSSAVNIPEAPDFLAAEQMTDCCPPVLGPDTALQRLEQNEFIYFALRNPAESCLDLSDDRYLNHLHPAEREIASFANLKCAEYMLMKRNYFKLFFEEIYRSEKKIDPNASSATTTTTTASNLKIGDGADSVVTSRQSSEVPISQNATPTRRRSAREATQMPTMQTPATQMSAAQKPATHTTAPPESVRRGGGWRGYRNRVRTEHAHQLWLEREYEFRSSRAKMVVMAWRELGFLDEGRYLDWVRAGGMFEYADLGGDARGEDNMLADGGL